MKYWFDGLVGLKQTFKLKPTRKVSMILTYEHGTYIHTWVDGIYFEGSGKESSQVKSEL